MNKSTSALIPILLKQQTLFSEGRQKTPYQLATTSKKYGFFALNLEKMKRRQTC